jgi:hypothetical protein
MHINVHIAVGIINTSILNYFFNFNILEYVFVLFLSFICDFDILFTKFVKNQNHRLYITHSLIPSIILIVIGIVILIYFNYNIILLGGFSYLFHILIDTFDWGTNLLYFPKKQNGFKLLMSVDELENLPSYLSQYKHPGSFFDKKYYGNKFCVAIEIALFCSMLIAVFLFAFQYIYFISLYFIGLVFHLSRHFHLKKSERN